MNITLINKMNENKKKHNINIKNNSIYICLYFYKFKLLKFYIILSFLKIF